MKKGSMIFRMMRKSVQYRKAQVSIIIAAIVVSAVLMTVLVAISMDISEKIKKELEVYGPNIFVEPKNSYIQQNNGAGGEFLWKAYLSEDDIGKIRILPSARYITGYVPYLYESVSIGGRDAVLVGCWFDAVKQNNPWWDIEGLWISERDDSAGAIVGKGLANSLNLTLQESFELKKVGPNGNNSASFVVKGIVTTGGPEDDQVYVNLAAVQNLTGHKNLISNLQLKAQGDESTLNKIATDIEGVMPLADAKTIQQVVSTQKNILSKFQILMTSLTLIILSVSGMVVMTTMTTIIIERRKEIGLMKALGAGSRRITTLLLSEVIFLGVIGGLVGYLMGHFISQQIGKAVFNTSISVNLVVLPIVVAISVGLMLFASAVPIRNVLRTTSSEILRGE